MYSPGPQQLAVQGSQQSAVQGPQQSAIQGPQQSAVQGPLGGVSLQRLGVQGAGPSQVPAPQPVNSSDNVVSICLGFNKRYCL